MKVGDRIELLAMPNDPDPIPVGSKDTIRRIGPFLGMTLALKSM